MIGMGSWRDEPEELQTQLQNALRERDESRALIDRIRGALATDETGEAIVEVAAAAHRSEMELATVSKDLDFWKDRATVMYWQRHGNKEGE